MNLGEKIYQPTMAVSILEMEISYCEVFVTPDNL